MRCHATMTACDSFLIWRGRQPALPAQVALLYESHRGSIREMWEVKALIAAFCILLFVGIVPIYLPRGWRLALPPASAAVIYLLIGITIGVLL
jgi:hypothetical protein